jgi:bacterioferritin
MINFVGQRDPTSRRMLESILAQEEEHAEDLVDLLEDLPKD